MPNQNAKSFTLIELLIVLAIISILSVVLIVTLKPGAIFLRARDTKRIGDLKNIEKIMDVLSTDQTFYELNYASSNVVYISLPDSSPTCSSWLSQLPSLPSGWSYRCSATPTNIDGTGWIPIPFSNFPILNISQLFIDPINKPPYYYSFVVGGSYKVTAKPEINYDFAINDGGIEPLLYEAGTDKKLSTFQSGLVLYLPFDEGSGTIARDLSGYNAIGTLYNGVQWVDGKTGKALSFDGVDDYFQINTQYTSNNPLTLCGWFSIIGDGTDRVGHDEREPLIDRGWEAFALKRHQSRSKAFVGSNNPSGTGAGWYGVNNVLLPGSGWLFLCGSVDESRFLRLYINGINQSLIRLNGSNPLGRANLASGVTRIGDIGGYSRFYGYADEVRLYNRALSDTEIKALYDATK
jgi:prepilin-type N-terminal cleavage/methylation domain-containing protein